MRIVGLAFITVSALLLSNCGGGGGGKGNNISDSSTVTLHWTAPSTRMDGSYLSLSELSGYRLYYGESINDRNILIDIGDNSITEYTLTREQDSALYYTVTAYDTLGIESDHSNAALK
jgi:fibronectin type 3 domain-containing protein